MRHVVLPATLFAVLACPLRGQARDAQPRDAQPPRHLPTDSPVAAILRARVDSRQAAGLAVGLVDRDGATRVVTYGRAAPDAPITARTVFEIGSITKTFTGALPASLVADGVVRLDQPVESLLPAGTVVPSRNGKAITLLDLVIHPLTPAFVVTIRREGDRLLAQATRQPPFEIAPESPTRFFLRGVEAELEFELDASGRATALTLVQGGARQRGVRR